MLQKREQIWRNHIDRQLLYPDLNYLIHESNDFVDFFFPLAFVMTLFKSKSEEDLGFRPIISKSSLQLVGALL